MKNIRSKGVNRLTCYMSLYIDIDINVYICIYAYLSIYVYMYCIQRDK